MEEVSSSPNEGSNDQISKENEPTLGTHKQSTKNVAPRTSAAVNDVEMIEDDDEVVVVGVNGRKLTSAVWKNFDQIKVNGEVKAKCKGCKNVFFGEGKNGTTHLKDHINRCLKTKSNMDLRQQLLKANSSKSGSSTLEMGGKFKFNAQVTRFELVNLIVLYEYPLAIVEHYEFRRYSRSLNPDFKVISRNTVKADILRDYKEERTRLMNMLAGNDSRVAITTNMWTSGNQRKGYMAVTEHYIDDDWVLQEQIIRFMYVPCHTTRSQLARLWLNV